MRLKCLGCEALARIVYLCAARSPQVVDVELLPIGLHAEPANLRAQLQDCIDATTPDRYDAILLAYGLCGQATAGLIASDIPLVIPRAHDCITLFLGDRERYKDQFENQPATYWYTLDYLERKEGSGAAFALGAVSEAETDAVYDEYVEKYGVENADYLMEVMTAWRGHYQRAVFIDTGVGDGTRLEERVQGEASQECWAFERMAGDLVLIRRLLSGDWETDFLVVEPGQTITMTYGDDVLGCMAVGRSRKG